jgi:hypothetical protein
MHFPCHSPKNLFFFLSPYVATLYNILILRRGCAEVRHFATGDAFCYSILLHHLWGRRKLLWRKGLRRAGRTDFVVSPYGTRVYALAFSLRDSSLYLNNSSRADARIPSFSISRTLPLSWGSRTWASWSHNRMVLVSILSNDD